MSRIVNDQQSGIPPARVLIVDDEAYLRALVARWLAEAGHACAQAASADEASECLRKAEFDLVLSDLNMPGRLGIDLLREIKKDRPDTAVIMLTGMGDAKPAIEALTQGATAYLLKPVEREELLFQVGSALERRHLIIERRQYTERLEQRVRQQTLTIRRAHEETIHCLVAASMYRDEETGMHVKRTGLLSELLAKAVGWSAAEAETIRMAAPMHDVGKIGIPDAILRKPGRLTPEEFEVMKTHAIIGANMLSGSKSPILQMAQEIALNHHERWNGGGYPAGLHGNAIPECARIVAIVDVYDALTHYRVYRPAFPEDTALTVMRQVVGTQFDPLLSAAFFSILPEVRAIAERNPEVPARWTTTESSPPAASPDLGLLAEAMCGA